MDERKVNYVYILNNIDIVEFSTYINVNCMITRLVMFCTTYCKTGTGVSLQP